jgi:PAS domain S-box-containing protein
VLVPIALVISIGTIALIVWAGVKRIAARNAERDLQQENLEQQAIELEEQALELELHVEELEQANAALVAANAATDAAHRKALAEMTERMRLTALFEAALRTVPIAMAIIDTDLRYIKVNSACAVMTGIDVDAHPGRTLREVNPRLAPELEAAMCAVLATGEPCINYRLSRPTKHAKDGALEIVMHITAFRDPDGTILGICSTATDVTQWKVLQDQFFQAQKLEAVGMLAAGIAHDFNNLLTVISSYCDLVLMELPANSPHREEIGEIRSAATRASTLARRMLGMTRSHALVVTPVELREVVLEARDLLAHAIQKNVKLEVVCADEPGAVLADPTHIEQVLVNLVINAVDAMPNGGALAVRTRDVTLPYPTVTRVGEIPAGEYVELTVADAGTGMDAATLSRIFEPFFTTKPRGKGTGLGLATVFGIVRDLHGGVDVESVLDRGTTFRILIPRLVAEEGTAPRLVRSNKAGALPRGDETLLLVEDEDALRVSMARVFERQGYRVLEASHGGEALRIMADDREIALIVSDLDMPGVGGRELAQRVHALGRHTPMLFMSGSSETDDSPDAASRGIPRYMPEMKPERDRFIAKPFEVETLLTTVREMLEPV